MKNAQIAALVLSKVNAGLTLRQAFDEVMGAGAYDGLAGQVYDALRA